MQVKSKINMRINWFAAQSSHLRKAEKAERWKPFLSRSSSPNAGHKTAERGTQLRACIMNEDIWSDKRDRNHWAGRGGWCRAQTTDKQECLLFFYILGILEVEALFWDTKTGVPLIQRVYILPRTLINNITPKIYGCHLNIDILFDWKWRWKLWEFLLHRW